jgi:hypothetical protein
VPGTGKVLGPRDIVSLGTLEEGKKKNTAFYTPKIMFSYFEELKVTSVSLAFFLSSKCEILNSFLSTFLFFKVIPEHIPVF